MTATLTRQAFRDIDRWMHRNARPLDLARWRYHFADSVDAAGARDEVLRALAAYQNEDGGMGHALEADSWNPHSTPIQCGTAIGVLHEIGWSAPDHAVVQGLLRYLDSGADLANGRWLNTVRSNNDYPHAPWWHAESESTSHSEYNPTAILAGFIIEYAARDSALYCQGVAIAHELATAFCSNPHLDMHSLLCVADLLQAIARAGLQQAFALETLQRLADACAQEAIRADATGWDGYAFRPSLYCTSPDSPLYAENRALVEQELDYLLARRNEAGIWDITWRWAEYPQAFAISENWWRANLAIKNVLFLDAFGRVEH